MTDPGATARPAAMEGGGAYNRSSRVQATGLLPAVAMLEAAARHAALEPSPRTIVIADYGASQGHNSLLPMSAAIAALRARVGVDRAILVVHTDQPDNDFGALFRTLSDDPDSYLRSDAAAFASAVGRSFYGQILPPDSVTLGWSSWSVQWLSRLPGPIPDQVQVAYSHDPAARAAYARQAAEDWHTFLTARSSELCPGGRLVVQTMALDDAGEFGYRPLLAAMYAELEKMVADRFLRPEELGRMAIPTVGRSRADLAAPFGPARRFGSLSLESLDIFGGEDQVWARFERTGDAVAFGREWAAFSRASVFPTLATALDGGREDPRHPAFPNRLEAGVAARLAADPCPMTIPLAKMMLVKDLAP